MNCIKAKFPSRPWATVTTALVAAVAAVACGGGGVGTEVTGAEQRSFSTGRISGLGSIIVNGVRFDDSTARIVDDDGEGRTRGDLKLGMVVNVKGGARVNGATAGESTAIASNIEFGSEVKGLVQSIDLAAGTLSVIGQSIKVDAGTVFEGFPSGLASVQPGHRVEIYAFFDSGSRTYQATRIEREDALDAFKLHGDLASLNTNTKTFVIGGATIGYSRIPAAELPALSNGIRVRVKLEVAQENGLYVATKIRTIGPNIEDLTEAEIEGVVTDFASLASFKVNGVAVNAGGMSVVFKDGISSQVSNGVRVEVEGSMQNNVLVARKVELEQDGPDGDDASIELYGTLDSVDAKSKSFALRGVVVTYDTGTLFENGGPASLIVNAKVEVKGKLVNGGTLIIATRVKFER